MDPIDVLDTLVQIAADVAGSPGTFYTIQNITGISPEHSSEDPTETRVFGREEAHSRGGELAHTYSLDGLWTPADTNAQLAIWQAYLDKDLMHVRYLPDGANGYRQKVRVVNCTHPAEADGEYVEFSCELRGVAGTLVEVGGES